MWPGGIAVTRKEWIQRARHQLLEAGVETPRLDAEVLTAYALGTDRIQLYMYPEKEITKPEAERLQQLVKRRASGEPVAYLTGHQEFMGLEFMVTPDVLIPRPDTEILVETVIETFSAMRRENPSQKLMAADIGTGSGCIAVSLAKVVPDLTVLAVDNSPAALRTATQNIRLNGVEGRVLPLEGHLLEPVQAVLKKMGLQPASLHVIVSNPPYLSDSEMEAVMGTSVAVEPKSALTGGPEGLDFYREITSKAQSLLCGGGLLAYEIGYSQGKAVMDLLTLYGFEQVNCLKDLAGHDRVVTGKKTLADKH
jgi:release factor glutamine methyltransferase